MTTNGAIGKTAVLLATTVLTAAAVWWKFAGSVELMYNATAWLIGSGIIGFILVLIASFKKDLSMYIAPLYAVAEGVFVGIVSMIYGGLFEGIVGQAALLTILVLGIMLLSYKMGWLRATPMFKKVIVFATAGIFVFYLLMMLASLMGFTALASFYAGSSPLSIGISAVVTGIAAFNLILDFDMMEQGEEQGWPKYMEWFSAMSLLVTLIWLYLEILRLLSKLRD